MVGGVGERRKREVDEGCGPFGMRCALAKGRASVRWARQDSRKTVGCAGCGVGRIDAKRMGKDVGGVHSGVHEYKTKMILAECDTERGSHCQRKL